MPEVFFNGPAGRLEGRFHPAKQRGAPIAVNFGRDELIPLQTP